MQEADAWFRVEIKSVYKNDGSSYKWHELTVCFRCDKEHSTVLCIGADPDFERLLKDRCDKMWQTLPSSNPWSMIVLVQEAMVALHDEAVWLIRDIVRDVEKVGKLTAW